MALNPAVARGRQLVRDALADLDSGDVVLLAVSGGPDSLALAAATAFESRSASWSVHAIVVDHRLQPGSSQVAKHAAEQTEALGIATHVVPVTVSGEGGPEAAARTARYAAIENDPANVVLLAHTLDDQAETVLMGLGRGSGPRSIAGMRAVHGRFRRPFLSLRSEETEAICDAYSLQWWADPHNDEPRFRRVRIRREVMPLLEDVLGGGAAEALARTAEQVRGDVDYLDAVAAELGDLSVEALSALPSALRLRVLRTAALDAGAAPDELNFGHIRRIDQLVTAWHGQVRIELPGHVSASRQGDRIIFGSTPVAG